jgi:hypothetical protein
MIKEYWQPILTKIGLTSQTLPINPWLAITLTILAMIIIITIGEVFIHK